MSSAEHFYSGEEDLNDRTFICSTRSLLELGKHDIFSKSSRASVGDQSMADKPVNSVDRESHSDSLSWINPSTNSEETLFTASTVDVDAIKRSPTHILTDNRLDGGVNASSNSSRSCNPSVPSKPSHPPPLVTIAENWDSLELLSQNSVPIEDVPKSQTSMPSNSSSFLPSQSRHNSSSHNRDSSSVLGAHKNSAKATNVSLHHRPNDNCHYENGDESEEDESESDEDDDSNSSCSQSDSSGSGDYSGSSSSSCSSDDDSSCSSTCSNQSCARNKTGGTKSSSSSRRSRSPKVSKSVIRSKPSSAVPPSGDGYRTTEVKTEQNEYLVRLDNRSSSEQRLQNAEIHLSHQSVSDPPTSSRPMTFKVEQSSENFPKPLAPLTKGVRVKSDSEILQEPKSIQGDNLKRSESAGVIRRPIKSSPGGVGKTIEKVASSPTPPNLFQQPAQKSIVGSDNAKGMESDHTDISGIADHFEQISKDGNTNVNLNSLTGPLAPIDDADLLAIFKDVAVEGSEQSTTEDHVKSMSSEEDDVFRNNHQRNANNGAKTIAPMLPMSRVLTPIAPSPTMTTVTTNSTTGSQRMAGKRKKSRHGTKTSSTSSSSGSIIVTSSSNLILNQHQGAMPVSSSNSSGVNSQIELDQLYVSCASNVSPDSGIQSEGVASSSPLHIGDPGVNSLPMINVSPAGFHPAFHGAPFTASIQPQPANQINMWNTLQPQSQQGTMQGFFGQLIPQSAGHSPHSFSVINPANFQLHPQTGAASLALMTTSGQSNKFMLQTPLTANQQHLHPQIQNTIGPSSMVRGRLLPATCKNSRTPPPPILLPAVASTVATSTLTISSPSVPAKVTSTSSQSQAGVPQKRGRGRPKGSKNKAKKVTMECGSQTDESIIFEVKCSQISTDSDASNGSMPPALPKFSTASTDLGIGPYERVIEATPRSICDKPPMLEPQVPPGSVQRKKVSSSNKTFKTSSTATKSISKPLDSQGKKTNNAFSSSKVIRTIPTSFEDEDEEEDESDDDEEDVEEDLKSCSSRDNSVASKISKHSTRLDHEDSEEDEETEDEEEREIISKQNSKHLKTRAKLDQYQHHKRHTSSTSSTSSKLKNWHNILPSKYDHKEEENLRSIKKSRKPRSVAKDSFSSTSSRSSVKAVTSRSKESTRSPAPVVESKGPDIASKLKSERLSRHEAFEAMKNSNPFLNSTIVPVFDKKYQTLQIDPIWRSSSVSASRSRSASRTSLHNQTFSSVTSLEDDQKRSSSTESSSHRVLTKASLKEMSTFQVSSPSATVGASTRTMLSVLAEANQKSKPGRKKRGRPRKQKTSPKELNKRQSTLTIKEKKIQDLAPSTDSKNIKHHKSLKKKKKEKLAWKSKHKNVIDPVFLSVVEHLIQDMASCVIETNNLSKDFWPDRPHDSVPSIFRKRKIPTGTRGRPPKNRGGKRASKDFDFRDLSTYSGLSHSAKKDDESSEQRLPLKKRHHHHLTKSESESRTATSAVSPIVQAAGKTGAKGSQSNSSVSPRSYASRSRNGEGEKAGSASFARRKIKENSTDSPAPKTSSKSLKISQQAAENSLNFVDSIAACVDKYTGSSSSKSKNLSEPLVVDISSPASSKSSSRTHTPRSPRKKQLPEVKKDEQDLPPCLVKQIDKDTGKSFNKSQVHSENALSSPPEKESPKVISPPRLSPPHFSHSNSPNTNIEIASDFFNSTDEEQQNINDWSMSNASSDEDGKSTRKTGQTIPIRKSQRKSKVKNALSNDKYSDISEDEHSAKSLKLVLKKKKSNESKSGKGDNYKVMKGNEQKLLVKSARKVLSCDSKTEEEHLKFMQRFDAELNNVKIITPKLLKTPLIDAFNNKRNDSSISPKSDDPRVQNCRVKVRKLTDDELPASSSPTPSELDESSQDSIAQQERVQTVIEEPATKTEEIDRVETPSTMKKRKRKANRTGFPSLKRKKRPQSTESQRQSPSPAVLNRRRRKRSSSSLVKQRQSARCEEKKRLESEKSEMETNVKENNDVLSKAIAQIQNENEKDQPSPQQPMVKRQRGRPPKKRLTANSVPKQEPTPQPPPAEQPTVAVSPGKRSRLYEEVDDEIDCLSLLPVLEMESGPSSEAQSGNEAEDGSGHGGSGGHNSDPKQLGYNSKAVPHSGISLKAGLFSEYYKTLDPPSRPKKISLYYDPADHPHGLLPPPYYCGRQLRAREEDFQLPYDLWWQHAHKQLPCRDVAATWNYKKIKNNIYYDVKPVSTFESQACHCNPVGTGTTPGCGDDCINRMTFSECDPRLCPMGERCTNNSIQKHKWKQGLERFMTDSKGWGIRTKQNISSGEFIMEYVGEVVSEKVFKNRMSHEYSGDTHHYCLHLDGGIVIDGHRVGGECRFVNHSCEPNCEIQKWTVNGLYRMALFSLREIKPGEELTYDYNFSLFNPHEGQACRCRTDKCRGVIGGRSQRLNGDRNSGDSSHTSRQSSTDRSKDGVKDGRKRSKIFKGRMENYATGIAGGMAGSPSSRLPLWAPMRPISNKEKNFAQEHRCFLLRNLEKIRQYREAMQRKVNGELEAAMSGTKEENNVAKPEEMIQIGLTAKVTARSMQTRRLTIAQDDPNVTRVVNMVGLFSEIFAQVTTIGDEKGLSLSRFFTHLPSKKKLPQYYEHISEPIDLQTIERNIKKALYSDPEQFDRDMLRLFQNNLRFYGHHSKEGSAALRLRKMFNTIKHEYHNELIAILGQESAKMADCFKRKDDPSVESGGAGSEDIIRCPCSQYQDEGMMIQCEKCQVWQHCDCVGENSNVEKYFCEKCSGREVSLDIVLVPQPEFACPGEKYYTSLMRENLQISLGDTVYVLRAFKQNESSTTNGALHSRVNKEDLESQTGGKAYEHGGILHKMMSPLKGPSQEASSLAKGNYPTFKTVDPSVTTADMDIFRIERLWANERGERFAFGHHYLRPHETFHEPSRRFFPNEVFRVPVYEVLPLDTIWGKCCVLDLQTYCKGRPVGSVEEHVYICEYRVDKNARLFNKISKPKYPVCTKWFAFDYFDLKLKPQRTYTPHEVPERWRSSSGPRSKGADDDSSSSSGSNQNGNNGNKVVLKPMKAKPKIREAAAAPGTSSTTSATFAKRKREHRRNFLSQQQRQQYRRQRQRQKLESTLLRLLGKLPDNEAVDASYLLESDKRLRKKATASTTITSNNSV